MKKEIKIDLNKLIKLKLPIEAYFLINTVYYREFKLITQYIESCGKIKKETIQYLIQIGYIESIDGDITFDKIKLTDRCIKDLELISDLDYNTYFNELKAVYPSVIKQNGRVIRRLHQSLDDCKKKYKAIIKSKEQHELILKCVKLYIEEQKKAGKEEFTSMLITFLNQRNYEQYLEEASKIDNIEDVLNSGDDDYGVI